MPGPVPPKGGATGRPILPGWLLGLLSANPSPPPTHTHSPTGSGHQVRLSTQGNRLGLQGYSWSQKGAPEGEGRRGASSTLRSSLGCWGGCGPAPARWVGVGVGQVSPSSASPGPPHPEPRTVDSTWAWMVVARKADAQGGRRVLGSHPEAGAVQKETHPDGFQPRASGSSANDA